MNWTAFPGSAVCSSLPVASNPVRRCCKTREEARHDVFDCIEMFRNPRSNRSRIEWKVCLNGAAESGMHGLSMACPSAVVHQIC